MELRSSAFGQGDPIPSKYTCDAEGVSLPLTFSGIPEDTKSLVLIMDDPDIPDSVKEQNKVEVWDHWVAFNISPSTREVAEGEEPEGVLGKNTGGGLGYQGPCPPDKEHRYFLRLYALDTTLDLPEGSSKADVEKALEGHVLAKAELMGTYNRK